jgi:hypothetical protein
MYKLRALFIASLAIGLAGIAGADTLQTGDAQNSSQFESASKPSRGVTMDRVAADFGEPTNRESAVGDPPIARWDYPTFVVFFEYDRVVHSVSKR